MKVSARNVFEGIVGSVHSGTVNAEVGIELPSGDKLVAVITLESVKSLQLTPGKPDQLTETGRFIIVWKLEAGVWKMARVVSYDHHLTH